MLKQPMWLKMSKSDCCGSWNLEFDLRQLRASQDVHQLRGKLREAEAEATALSAQPGDQEPKRQGQADVELPTDKPRRASASKKCTSASPEYAPSRVHCFHLCLCQAKSPLPRQDEVRSSMCRELLDRRSKQSSGKTDCWPFGSWRSSLLEFPRGARKRSAARCFSHRTRLVYVGKWRDLTRFMYHYLGLCGLTWC